MPFWITSSCFLKKHRLIPYYSMLSTTQKEVTLKQAGSVQPVDQENNDYNKLSQIRTVTLT